MKKLLTILVSAASACFAFADEDGFISGTSFESYDLGETGFAELKLSDEDADGKRYWLSGAESDFGIVTNYQSDTAIPSDITRPTKFASEDNNKYLRLDTSDTLFRTINSYDTIEEVITTNAVDIGNNGIYFDSLVQFTATEDDVTPSKGDKLVVWLKAVEAADAVGTEGEEGYVAPVDGSTNLVITAGNGFYEGGDDVDQAIPTHFFTSKAIESGSWHRLTIKAFVVNNERTYFNVFIDGDQVTYVSGENEVTDFESLVSYINDDSKTISGVGFKGTGAVDDLVFTTSDPLYVAPSTYAITGPEVGGGISSIIYSSDEDGANPIEDISAIDVGTTEVWAYITLQNGYQLDSATYNGVAVTGNPDEFGGISIRLAVDAPVANNTYAFVVTVSATGETELPMPGVAAGDVIDQPYSEEAEAAIRDAMDNVGGAFDSPDEPVLVVEVNGEVLLGNAAVEMINEVTKVFEIGDGNFFFDAKGKMEVTFKATSADPAKITYEAKVGGVNATVKAAYQVVPKYINLATGDVIEDPGEDATAKFFKLVIEAKATE